MLEKVMLRFQKYIENLPSEVFLVEYSIQYRPLQITQYLNYHKNILTAHLSKQNIRIFELKTMDILEK